MHGEVGPFAQDLGQRERTVGGAEDVDERLAVRGHPLPGGAQPGDGALARFGAHVAESTWALP